MRPFSDTDAGFMRDALSHALAAKGTTFPNPSVGAVIVRDGAVVGKGATAPWGGPHAEISALRESGPKARGATLYVTLEPCNHQGRTPPCTRAVVEAGVREVIVAARDPNPLVSGRGVRYLRSKGIAVRAGLLAGEAEALNEDYAWTITRQRPWVSLKIAASIDGRIADQRGDSKWITSLEARAFGHDLRRRHAAVAVGAGTLRADNPRLTVRLAKGSSPVRIAFVSSPSEAAGSLFRQKAKLQRSIFVCRGGKAGSRDVAPDGVELWFTGSRRGKPEFERFLSMAHGDGLTSILVEGGATIASRLLEYGLVNRLYWFVGNVVLGGGLEAVSFDGKALRLPRAIRVASLRTQPLGDSVLMTGLPVRNRE